MHPAFLDACLHAYPLVLDGAVRKTKSVAAAPTCPSRWKDFAAIGTASIKHGCTLGCVVLRKDDTQVIDIQVYDEAERPVADLDGLTVRLLPLDKVQPPRAGPDDCFIGSPGGRAIEHLPTLRSIAPQQAG